VGTTLEEAIQIINDVWIPYLNPFFTLFDIPYVVLQPVQDHLQVINTLNCILFVMNGDNEYNQDPLLPLLITMPPLQI